MITYTLSRIERFLREALAQPAVPQVTLSRTRFVVHVDHVVHHVRRDGVCSCGATPKAACPAILAVQSYIAAGGSKPLGRHPDTWPSAWDDVPALCPICDCPTIPDRYLNSRAGPGWRCRLTNTLHFWQVRVERLRRLQRRYPPKPAYPWYDTPIEEQVWTPQAKTMTEGEDQHAPLRPPPCAGCHRPGVAVPWLDPVRLLGGQVGCDDGLLRARLVAGDR